MIFDMSNIAYIFSGWIEQKKATNEKIDNADVCIVHVLTGCNSLDEFERFISSNATTVTPDYVQSDNPSGSTIWGPIVGVGVKCNFAQIIKESESPIIFYFFLCLHMGTISENVFKDINLDPEICLTLKTQKKKMDFFLKILLFQITNYLHLFVRKKQTDYSTFYEKGTVHKFLFNFLNVPRKSKNFRFLIKLETFGSMTVSQMTTQNMYSNNIPAFSFIRPGMTIEEQYTVDLVALFVWTKKTKTKKKNMKKLEQWKTEYAKLYQQQQQERKAWEMERSEGLLLLNDYRKDNQQLEIEKRQWEQEREFGAKLMENLQQRVNHYILKIRLIEKFYNIDINNLDNHNFVNQMYKDHLTYDPTKIVYVNTDDVQPSPSPNADGIVNDNITHPNAGDQLVGNEFSGIDLNNGQAKR
ncbi:hypothetical protein RFI_18155, partial [Reticulomyxa filosa]